MIQFRPDNKEKELKAQQEQLKHIKFEDLGAEKKIVKLIIDLAMEYGQEKKGSFFVITQKDLRQHYRWLYTDILEDTKANIQDKKILPLIRKLAELDGAMIFNEEGYLVAYGAEIKKTRIYNGHGARHGAALAISEIPGTLAIISSQEDGAVRIFRKGITLVEINPYKNAPHTLSERVADMATSASITGTALALGANPLVAVAIFTGSYIITKSGAKSIGDFLKAGHKAWKNGKK